MIFTLLGLSVLLFAFQQINNKDIKENFAGNLPNMKVKVQRVVQSPRTGDFVEVPGNYQSILSPIGGAGMVDYGALIRYKMPSNTFHQQFEAGELGDEMDFFEWSGLYELWQDMQHKIELLESC